MPRGRRRKPRPETCKGTPYLLFALICQANTPQSLLASCVTREVYPRRMPHWVFMYLPPRRSDIPAPTVGLLFITTISCKPKHSLGGRIPFVLSGFPILHLRRYHPIPTNGYCTLPPAPPGWADYMRHSKIFLHFHFRSFITVSYLSDYG